jgi:GTP cyclohydrolase I
MKKLKDIQKEKPKRGIEIDEVGISKIRLPLKIIDKKYGHQQTMGEVSIFVNLLPEHKGTHMSRFIEILNKYSKKTLDVEILDDLIKEILENLNAERGKLEIDFTYFITKKAPVSKKSSLMGYRCKSIRIANKGNKNTEHIIQVEVPITTVCPCSKEISKYGAHNQRGYVTVRVKFNKFIWIEDIINLVEKQASCEIYPLLKRIDEKFVTEKAYDNPKFVEDIVRDVSFELQKDKRVDWFKIECENEESIHSHNVYASITKELS